METARAIEHYNNNVEGTFEFKLYNDTKVKDELKKIFAKCAYCESSYGAVYDGDVEHFRPKGRIKEKDPATPGYYWLANNWDNLFLACQHCNQRRKANWNAVINSMFDIYNCFWCCIIHSLKNSKASKGRIKHNK